MHDGIIFVNHKMAWEVWAPTLGGMGTYPKRVLLTPWVIVYVFYMTIAAPFPLLCIADAI